VIVVAAVDEVRNREAEPPATTTELKERDEFAERLGELGVRGELVLRGSGCRVQLLSLPSLERTGEDESGCVPHGAESPDGSTVARCLGDEVELFSGGGFVRTLPGCVPAWRPDGVLTVALRGAIVRFRVCADGRRDTCTRTLIPRTELERAARRHPTSPALAPLRVLVDGVAWLSNVRASVLMSIRLTGRFAGMGPMSAIAFFEQGRLTKTQPFFRTVGGQLGASPRGSYVTQTPDVILRPDGSQVSLPEYLRAVRDFAWSPDERFLALATRFAVVVLDVSSLERYDDTGSGLRSVTLPLSVTELAWR
jgi:hypothetical protein